MRFNYLLFTPALLAASSAVAVPADSAATSSTSSSYPIIPIYPTSRTSTSLQTVMVTKTINVGSDASSSSPPTPTTSDPNDYSVVPIEGLPPATTLTVTVLKSGTSVWTVTPTTGTVPLGSGTGYSLPSSTMPVVVSAASRVSHAWSLSAVTMAVAGGVLAVATHW
ncbi:hypothetical protein CFIMG_008366RA00001 [Ceratocystis fimbriata CBS 114723]|uniref:Uncharacterized protein n=1 Tax=Ceratocystis fimbriata CBS 114723 TaxID=1035309 RepID=A0A2C5X3U4_9PEZI|nr:hypothetical protein CFIMG_008366RA00001 [Ceratocystis fimbriata CBS 114723]